MSARRCGACEHSWPVTELQCPVCGASTWLNHSLMPDEGMPTPKPVSNTRPAPATPTPEAGTKATTNDTLRAHRVERYLDLGFPLLDAELLAKAIEVEVDKQGREWSRALNWLRVKKTLEAGATHDQAVMIYA